MLEMVVRVRNHIVLDADVDVEYESDCGRYIVRYSGVLDDPEAAGLLDRWYTDRVALRCQFNDDGGIRAVFPVIGDIADGLHVEERSSKLILSPGGSDLVSRFGITCGVAAGIMFAATGISLAVRTVAGNYDLDLPRNLLIGGALELAASFGCLWVLSRWDRD